MSSLAIDGGPAVRSTPMPGWPHYDADERDAAGAVLESGRVNYWTGDECRSFEREFASWNSAPFAVAVSNGTVALELALGALGVGAGDEVVVPAATFVATAAAVATCGAVPVVADIDPATQGLSADTLEAAITPRTVAVVVVHLAGVPADMPAIMQVARRHGLRVVEDCAQAHGARLGGQVVGGFGDIAAWSFCQDKILSTGGEGGAVTTADEALWRRCWERKDHGKNYDAVFHTEHPPGFRWLHDRFGTNARMTEFQAAIGRIQLHKLGSWVATRRSHAAALTAGLEDLVALRLPAPSTDAEPAWYRYYVHVRPDRLAAGWDRGRVCEALQAEGAQVNHGGCMEIHRERAFANIRPTSELPVAAELGRTALAVLVHPTLTGDDVHDTVEAFRKVMAVATA
ncbi:MAG: DegT/DnrJ/EryC1/StrS family aminotransferase [Pseudonocardia sp.]